ncbi:MAG: hypothetical protein IJQ60_10880 [Prevotella sp.]|nr:hypothetical protein [Prevotella sp.]
MTTKQVWVAECDLCGKTEPARRTTGRYNETEHTLPEGWAHGVNKNFCVCPDCVGGNFKLLEVEHD